MKVLKLFQEGNLYTLTYPIKYLMKIIVIKVLTSAVGGSKIRLLLLDVMDLLLLHALGIY